MSKSYDLLGDKMGEINIYDLSRGESCVRVCLPFYLGF